MSRIGKKQLAVPANTEVTISGNVVTVKGPKGTITKTLVPMIDVKVADNIVTVTPKEESLETNALWGTYASHISNMIEGVNNLFSKKLILEGIGYKGEVANDTLKMALGFSHPVNVKIPEGVKVLIEKATWTFSGHDKEVVSQFASQIRSLKKPEPYKGKGFRYSDEVIARKQGKKSV